MAVKYIDKILQDINDTGDVEKYKDDALVRIIFENAFNPANKWILPEGNPPYKPSEEDDMSPTNMYLEARRIGYIFKREDLTPVKREGLFIELLESVSHAEAKILLAIKDQRLDKIYPKITPELASKVADIDTKEADKMIAEAKIAEEKAKKPHQSKTQKRDSSGKFTKKAK